MIAARDLHKSFGGVRALCGLSFDALDGTITGLLGPNGAGKTTALRIVYTLLRPTAGAAEVDGFDTVAQSSEVRRRIGALPDSRGLYPRLTTRENLRYHGRLHGLDGAPLEARIETLVALLDMQDIAERRTEGFSTGQQLKVAIARSMVHDPQNLLLDEPTSGLDVMATRAMRAVIRRIRDEGKCILFSSHVMQEVAALCEKIVVIKSGARVAEGSPAELQAATGATSLEDAFVATIGSAEGLG